VVFQNYDNEKVQEIRKELGDFDFSSGDQTKTSHELEHRDMLEQDNHARYEGEW